MKSLLRSALIFALLALPLAAQSDPGRGPHAEGIGRALHLSEVQKASIQAIRAKHRPDLILRRDAVQHAQIDLRTALQDAAIPETRLRTLYDKTAGARFDMILAQRSVRLEVQGVLTPEQRAKAAEMHEHLRRQRRAAWIAG
jgi:Spy/CpxP family protein refolding chaperone